MNTYVPGGQFFFLVVACTFEESELNEWFIQLLSLIYFLFILFVVYVIVIGIF